MSQILLYITLIITSSASAGDVNNSSYESNAENAVFSTAHEKSDALQMLSEFDYDIDVSVSDIAIITSIKLNNKSLPSSYSPPLKTHLNSVNIRAPPAIS